MDNLKDLIVGEYNGYVWFYKNVGTNAAPVFNSSEQLRLQNGTVIRDIANTRVHFNDWTGDGDLDMLMGDYGTYDGNVRLYENTADVSVSEGILNPRIKDFLTVTPNPVVNQALFIYSLAEAGLVRVNVYSIDGQPVAKLINRAEAKGNRKFTWDLCDANGNKLSAGVYYLRFETKNNKQVKRLVLLK